MQNKASGGFIDKLLEDKEHVDQKQQCHQVIQYQGIKGIQQVKKHQHHGDDREQGIALKDANNRFMSGFGFILVHAQVVFSDKDENQDEDQRYEYENAKGLRNEIGFN